MPPRPTRPVTFTCEWCYHEVTEDRAPGPMPAYCRGCKDEVRRAGVRQRVKEHRERQRERDADPYGLKRKPVGRPRKG